MSFYVLESDMEQAETLHNFIVEMKAESLHLVTKKQYSKADVCEKEAQKAIRELRELENKRIDVEREIRQREQMILKSIVNELVRNGINAEIATFKGRKAQ